jgi:Sel1 repeat
MEMQENPYRQQLAQLERSIRRMRILTAISAIVILTVVVERYGHHNPAVAPHVATAPVIATNHNPVSSQQNAAAEQSAVREHDSNHDTNKDRQPRAPKSILTASRDEVISAIQERVQGVQDGDLNRTLNQANARDFTAQYQMGLHYADGEGVPQNFNEAMTWFAKASDAGNAKAQWKLALGYLKGIGVPRDERQAVVWLKRAANNGDTRAQKTLSQMYQSGQGVQRDYVRAYTWANIAAESEGSDSSQLQTIRSQMTANQIADAERRTSLWRDYANRKDRKPTQ